MNYNSCFKKLNFNKYINYKNVLKKIDLAFAETSKHIGLNVKSN